MQDALPALVLNSEALLRQPMSDTPPNSPSGNPGAAGASPNDERLMLDFTLGSSEAFSELFRRYKQPIYGFFRRRVTDPAHAEELSQQTWIAVLAPPPVTKLARFSALISTPSLSKSSAPIAAKQISALCFLAGAASVFWNQRSRTRPNPAFGSA